MQDSDPPPKNPPPSASYRADLPILIVVGAGDKRSRGAAPRDRSTPKIRQAGRARRPLRPTEGRGCLAKRSLRVEGRLRRRRRDPRQTRQRACPTTKIEHPTSQFKVPRVVDRLPAPPPGQSEVSFGPWAEEIPEPLRDVVPIGSEPVDVECSPLNVFRLECSGAPRGNQPSLLGGRTTSACDNEGVAGGTCSPDQPKRARSSLLRKSRQDSVRRITAGSCHGGLVIRWPRVRVARSLRLRS